MSFFQILTSLAVVASLASTALAAPMELPVTHELDMLNKRANEHALARLQAKYEGMVPRSGGCSINNLGVRQEFGSMAPADRAAYTNAVLCLQAKGANTPASLVPGAKSRYDDFVATHINQTLTIHYTGTFLAWHRYFTWVYEQALRNECGYTGYQPYWDWPRYVDAPQRSPIFNGDAYSIGGNGAYIPNHPGTNLTLTVGTTVEPTIYLPPGLGGGCVTTGPFAKMSVNLGPVVQLLNSHPSPNPYAYNPRCLKRDLGPAVAQAYTNIDAVTNLLLTKNDVYSFQMAMQGVPGSGNIGVHGGGHYTINGDPGGDLFVSPGDPAFFLHHSQIDRMWTIWQLLDFTGARLTEISGTLTFLNEPPSANVTLDTTINLGFAGGSVIAMKDLLSTTAGPFCYIYL